MTKPSLTFLRRKLQVLVRQTRQEAGLRQIDVAQGLGCSQSFVSKIEHGQHRMDFVEVSHFCDAVGVDLLDFIHRYEASLKTRIRAGDLENRRRVLKPKRRRS